MTISYCEAQIGERGMGRPSAFKSDTARAECCRMFDEALARSPLPDEELDLRTSFVTTHVLTAGDPFNPPLVQ